MGMSYTTGDFYTNGTSGLGAPKKIVRKQLPPLKRHVMNGVGAPLAQGDFGGLFDDISKWATNTYQQQVTNLQSQASTAVNKAVTTFVDNLTGKKVTLTPAQQAAYNASGVLPSQVAPEPSFMDQYGKYIMIGGGVLAGLVALSLIVKMVKK